MTDKLKKGEYDAFIRENFNQKLLDMYAKKPHVLIDRNKPRTYDDYNIHIAQHMEVGTGKVRYQGKRKRKKLVSMTNVGRPKKPDKEIQW